MSDVSRLLAELTTQVNEIDHTRGMRWAAVCLQTATRGRPARNVAAGAKDASTPTPHHKWIVRDVSETRRKSIMSTDGISTRSI